MRLYDEVLRGIAPVDENARKEAIARLDSLAKPIGSLGKLEDIAAKIAAITGKVRNNLDKKCTIIMCADNGVVEEGVSSSPQYVTAMQSINFCKGLTGVCVLSKHAGADIRVIDVGINDDIEYPGLINKKLRKGTGNIAKGPAMTVEEAVSAIEIGISTVGELYKEGYSLLGTGEMGIGNTTTSSAVAMCLMGLSADDAVGKGAGLTEEGLANKKSVIERAIDVNKPDRNNPLEVLAKVGGLDIAGLTGCFLGAAYYKVPIVIDGFISSVAALVAYRLNPLVRDYMLPSHCSAEPGYKLVMKELGLQPLLDLDMRLGEGSGCPLAFNIIEAAEHIICNMATFSEANIADDFLIDIRK